MADKRKQNLNDDKTHESDRQFLDRTGVSNQIKDVLTQIVENRPENAVAFLADYFETIGDKVNRVVKAHQQLCLTHYSRPAFETNIHVAYDILSHGRVNKQVKGLTGDTYTELLHMMCRDFPAAVKERLLKKIQCRYYEVVVYDVFKSGVFTCLVLQDFLKLADNLFRAIDLKGSGKADLPLCEVVIQQLAQALSKNSTDPTAVLEAGYTLGPDKLSSALSKAGSSKTRGSVTITRETFVTEIADSFLSKVNVLR